MNVRQKILGALLIGATTLGLGVIAPGAAQAQSAFHPITNTTTNMCLQPQTPEQFVTIVQHTCDGSLLQKWVFIKVGNNHYRILNQLSGFCFDAFDGAFGGARILQNECAPISNDEFNTGGPVPGVVKLESRVGFRDRGFCIGVGAAPLEGLAAQLTACSSTQLGQRWSVGVG
jgi:ricin-type beta-trefoil lectin protein